MTSAHGRITGSFRPGRFEPVARFSGRSGAPDWRAYLGLGDTRHSFGERGEVEGCQVIHFTRCHVALEVWISDNRIGASGHHSHPVETAGGACENVQERRESTSYGFADCY